MLRTRLVMAARQLPPSSHWRGSARLSSRPPGRSAPGKQVPAQPDAAPRLQGVLGPSGCASPPELWDPRVWGGEARPATPTRDVSCFARFSLGLSSLAPSPSPILDRGSGDFPSLLGKAVPAPGAATKPLRPQQLSQNPSPEREARLGTPTGSTELVASGRTELTVPRLGRLLA